MFSLVLISIGVFVRLDARQQLEMLHSNMAFGVWQGFLCQRGSRFL